MGCVTPGREAGGPTKAGMEPREEGAGRADPTQDRPSLWTLEARAQGRGHRWGRRPLAGSLTRGSYGVGGPSAGS